MNINHAIWDTALRWFPLFNYLFYNLYRSVNFYNLVDVSVDNAVCENLDRSVYDNVLGHLLLNGYFDYFLNSHVFNVSLVHFIFFVWIFSVWLIGAHLLRVGFKFPRVHKRLSDLISNFVDGIKVKLTFLVVYVDLRKCIIFLGFILLSQELKVLSCLIDARQLLISLISFNFAAFFKSICPITWSIESFLVSSFCYKVCLLWSKLLGGSWREYLYHVSAVRSWIFKILMGILSDQIHRSWIY